jgi:predicted nucleic acid-binding protein
VTVVSDTGPLIALAKVNQLRLLEQLYGQVRIPPAVHRELLAKRGPEAARLDDALAHFIGVAPVVQLSPEVEVATLGLDPGEGEAIALAYGRRTLLVIDDFLGRVAARRLGLSITGVVGLLIRAKEAALIPAVRPLLGEIRRQGYWLSDELLDVATRLAGED